MPTPIFNGLDPQRHMPHTPQSTVHRDQLSPAPVHPPHTRPCVSDNSTGVVVWSTGRPSPRSPSLESSSSSPRRHPSSWRRRKKAATYKYPAPPKPASPTKPPKPTTAHPFSPWLDPRSSELREGIHGGGGSARGGPREDWRMHLYNAWLPPPVATAARGEAAAFAGAVRTAAGAWLPGDPDSAYATLKWISVFDLFIKAKSDIAPEDVQALVKLGLEIFHASHNKFVVQIKWGGLLIRLLRKHGKRLSLDVQWRPLYDTLIRTHFKRNMGPEGWKVRKQHFETVTSLVRASRNFFPEGVAAEIWSEFRFGIFSTNLYLHSNSFMLF
ncbi:proteasome activator subunit 4-like [Miscanthus floridulus]|uniref:proteasome activator subunit 4-like n=1 Tax=Miscanthus floridulus TaxID=154761 RepID=UPI0034597BFC